MIAVVVAAASDVVRAGLEALVASDVSLNVAGATTLERAAALARELDPDVLLADVERGDESLLPLRSPAAGAEAPGLAVVLLTDAPDREWATAIVTRGARGVLHRGAAAPAILAAIHAAAAGLVAMEPALATSDAAPVGRRQNGARAPALSQRETEVLALLADGLANKQIAARLAISEHTVKTHVASILEKLAAGSRAEAVAIGARRGLLML